MARKLKAQGGPLDGRTVIVHETQETFTHHADTGGHYKVNEKSVTWQSHTPPVEKPKRTTKAKAPRPTAPKHQAPAQADAPTENLPTAPDAA